MTNLEIKKLYKKTKAAFERRTGRKLTWHMSGAQMAKGTATICTASVPDFAALVRSAENEVRDAEREAKKRWFFIAARAREEEADGGRNGFWREEMNLLVACYGDLNHMVETKRREAEAWLAEARAVSERVGSQAAETARRCDEARNMAEDPEIAAFVEAIGGKTTVEVKRDGWRSLVYLRFHYNAD